MASIDSTLLYVIISVAVVFFCCIFILCCVIYYFWRKNRRLIREQKKEEQPLNTNGQPNTTNNGSHHNTSNNNGMNSGLNNSQNHQNMNKTPYSPEDTTNSSDMMNVNTKTNWDDSKYDVNFLVHPENYAPASQASNSGNDVSNLRLPPNSNLGAPTVTTSTSLSGNGANPNKTTMSNPQRGAPNTHLNNHNNNHLSHSHPNATHNQMITGSGNRGPPYPNSIYQQQQQQQKQQLKLMEIIRNARNKLQMINSKHISFEYEVGRGKFGKVFRALWTDTNTKQQKTVAVKWFKQDEVDQEVFQDFLKEIAVAAHLPPHDNVLQIYGFCISPYALVTEYVNGGSVEICVSCKHDRNIRNNITIGDCVQMFIDTARGISHLHTVNIIHRDVAARNLLIEDFALKKAEMEMNSNANVQNNQIIWEERDPSKKRRVVVCDFGLSRITQNPDQDNVTNSHVGPLKWMSPESIKQQIYNSKTDVYSFGVVMWEVLCGMPPYPQTKVLSLAVEVISKQTRPYVLEWFPRPLKILMQRCWQEIQEFRPTFEDIKNELDMFKQELIRQNKQNQPLITISADDLNAMGKTKEKLRSLQELVGNYLQPKKYHWDNLLKPKLEQLIREYNEAADYKMNQQQQLAQMNMQRNSTVDNSQNNNNHNNNNGGRLALNNNISESTYYDEQISVMQQMNISNKRISTEVIDGEHVLNINQSPKVSKVRFDDEINSIPYSNNKILPLLTSNSLSVENNENNENNGNNIDNLNDTHIKKETIHNLGHSVQID